MRAPLVLASLALAFGASPYAAAESRIFADSGIDGPPYDQILRSESELKSLHPGWVSVADYGRTALGRTLRVVKIQSPTRPTSPRSAVLISGATHGDEYLGIEDRLAGWFLENRESSPGLMRFLGAGGVIYLFPIVNPDGYESHRRENSNGVDLNRDFDLVPTGERKFREAETRQLATWLDQDLTSTNTRLKLTVDYHCCTGALLFPWSYTDSNLPANVQRGHTDVAHLMQQDIDATYEYGNTSTVLGYYANGTSKDYFYAKYGVLAFTYEGAYREEAGKFQEHTVWWDHVLGGLASTEAIAH